MKKMHRIISTEHFQSRRWRQNQQTLEWRSIMPWLSVPLFLAAIPIIHVLQPQFRLESAAVVSMLYTLFCASPSLMVTVLAGQTYLEKGSVRMLLLGIGAVFFGAIYLTAALLLPDYNAGVTVHNFGFLISGLCFLFSGLFPDKLESRFLSLRLTLSLAYLAAAGTMTLWIWGAYQGLLPTFYIPGAGYTPLRHFILGMGVATFAISSLWYWRLYLRNGNRFDRWFCQGVALIGVAMVAAILIPAGGTAMAWLARAAQCIGGIFMLIAILSAVQDTGAWRIPLEQALRQKESQYRTVVENVSEGLFVIDGGGNILLANEAMIKLAGWNRAPGGSLEDYSKRIQVRNAQGHDVSIEQWPASRALRGEVVRDQELRIQRLDTGREYTALFSAQPIRDDSGRIERVVITVRDITERKQAEEALRQSDQRLRDVMDNMVAMIGMMTPDGVLIEANRTALEAANLKSEDVLGKPFEECYWWAWSPEVQKRLRAAIERAAAGEGSRYDEVIRVGDGEFKTIDFMVSPMFDSDGRISYLIPSATDISDRKRAEEAIRRSEARYRELVQSANSAIIRWSVDGTITFFNEYAQDFFGWSTEEVVGRHVGILVPEMESTGGGLTSLVRDIVEQPELYVNNINENICRDGHRVWMNWTNRPICDEQGRVTGILAIGSDITALKHAEEALRESEHLYRTVGETIPYGIWQTDASGACTYISDSFLEMTGTTWPELQQFGWLHLLLPEDREPTQEHWLRCVRTGEDFQREHRFRAKDGTTRFVLAIGRPVRDDQGKIVSWVGINLDINDRKRVEEALEAERANLQAVLDSLPVAVWIADRKGNVIHTNQAVDQIWGKPIVPYGIEKYGEYKGWWADTGELLAPEEWALARAVLKDEISTGEVIDIERFNGTRGTILNNAAPVKDSKDRIIGGVAVAQDITERKRAEEALRESEERIKRSLAEKEVLLKEIHHRVKNNMQVISSLVDLQADEVKDPAMRGIFQDVIYRVRSMAMIHEKLYQSADLAQVDFADYAQSLLGYLWRAQGPAASNIQLNLDLKPVLLSVNTAVPCGLILNELFSNALKHAFRGRNGGRVTVSLREDGQGKVLLGVDDNGIGLPQELDWEKSRSLGLRIVKTLARQLHADVTVASAGGTVFSISFERPHP